MSERHAFTGTVPTVRCRDVSGAECTRTMRDDAEHCGDPSHVRVVPPRAVAPEDFIGQARPSKRRIIVDEDYEVVADDLRADTFDPSRLVVGVRAQRAFTSHHGTDASTAIDELRFLAAEALRHGTYGRTDGGFHSLWFNGFGVVISPDGSMITGYRTLHYERTPRQVAEGVPSRFGKRLGRGDAPRRVPGPPLPLDELVAAFDPATTEIARTALRLFAKREGIDEDDPALEPRLRRELADAAATGTWRAGDRGPDAFVLEGPTRCWIVAADSGLVISQYRPDDEARAATS